MNHSAKFALCLRAAQRIVESYRAEAPIRCDPQNSGVAAASVIASLVSTGAQLYSQNKAAKAAGGVPKAAPYVPLDLTDEQRQAVKSNLKSLPEINQLVGQNNAIVTADALNRAKRLIPGYASMMETEGRNASNLLQGQVPWDDVMGIVADSSGLNGAIGVPGTGAPATLRDLGISRLSAIQSGSGMLKDMVGIAEQISPRSSYYLPQNMFVTPKERIAAQLGQVELGQQSAQSANNLAAAPNPGAMAQASTIASAGSAASSLINSLGSMYSKGYFSGTPSGTYEGAFPTNPNPGVRNRIYRGTSIPV